jgi:hypothetical protein
MMRKQLVPPVLVGCVCLFFFAIWAGNLGHAELTEEESIVDVLASQPVGQLLQHLDTDEPHPPLFYLMQHVWNLAGGTRNEFLVRFPSVVLGILLLCLTYRLGRALGLGWVAALVSIIWLGLIPQLTYHVREARMYPLMAVTAVLAAVTTVSFERLPRRGALWIAVGTCAVALLSHYFNALFVGVFTVWGGLTFRAATRRRWLLAQVIAWAIFAGWTLFFGRAFWNPAALSEAKAWSFILPPWDVLAGLVRSAVFGYRDVPVAWLGWIGGGVFIGLWLLGVFLSRGRTRTFLFGVVVIPCVAYAAACWVKPLYHPKYALPWLALATPAVGWALTRRPRLGGGLMVATLVLMISPTVRTIQLPYAYASPIQDPGRQNYWLNPIHRQMGEYLRQYAGAADAFGYGAPSIADCYYADFYIRSSLGCHILVEKPGQPLTAVADNLTNLLNQSTILWYRNNHNSDWEPSNVAQEALNQRAVALGTENATGIPLQLYTSPATILSQQQPIDVRFGDIAQLTGIWLAARGDLHLALVWRSLADHPSVTAKVFVHLVDAKGELIAQADGVPVSWTRPFETWHFGEQLLDVYSLSLPAHDLPLSDFTLQIGLYNPETGARLGAYDSAGNPLPEDKVTLPVVLLTSRPGRS